ncbi:MAG: signal peptide protein, partial [Paenibacillaceae bacterium]|nr:signal peptide protein [Paenibacillaceae bacterium]
ASLEQHLGEGRWDVIHFNWGLHDIAYRNPESQEQGHRDKINGTLSTEPDRYKSNLEQIVALLKQAGTKLIWASTTVVSPDEAGRFEGDEVKYNEIATEIMEANGIIINDLYSVTRQFGPEMFTAPGNVHFTKEGYEKLAEQVASKIQSALGGQAG